MRRISRAVRVSGFLLASAVCAGPGSASPVFMKFDRFEGTDKAAASGGQIEIQSFHWGPRQSTSAEGARRGGVDEKISITGGRTESGDPDRPVIIGSLPNPPAAPMQYNPKEYTVAKSKERDGPASKDMVLKGSKIGENAPVGASQTLTVGSARTEARAHDKRTTWVERSAPAAKGSVWIRVASPWTACRAGARYPMIELGDGKASYRLSDVVVTGCDGGGATLDYAKVIVRGWDPAKKEE